jgi:hypothetical protein
MLALLLALLWAPATSHCLLEHAGWIHHSEVCADHDANVDHEHDTNDSHGHDGADGEYQLPSTGLKIAKRTGSVGAVDDVSWLPVDAALSRPVFLPDSGGAPANATFCRDFSPRWQFVLRTALPPRAPSC